MANDKKDGAKFTIRFNNAIPRQREAMRMLDEAGRGKATLIADALHFYARIKANMEDALLHNSMQESAPTTFNKGCSEGFASNSTTNTAENCDSFAFAHASPIDVNQSIVDSLNEFNC